MIIPSIDISGGKVVRLRNGKKVILRLDDVYKIFKDFSLFGNLTVIDIDAAKGTGNNLNLIKSLLSISSCNVGGGIRTVDYGKDLLAAGAKKLIIGTKTNSGFLKNFHPDNLLAAVDIFNNKLASGGWEKYRKINIESYIKKLSKFVSGFILTNIRTDGTLNGVDKKEISKYVQYIDKPVIIGGGIRNINEIKYFDKRNIDCQVGLALLTGKISVIDGFIDCLNFKKGNGLIPALIKDLHGRIRMLGYMNKEALKKTFMTKTLHLWSRTRNRLWCKGEKSGAKHEILSIKSDCDRDSLIVVVKYTPGTCHSGAISCFGYDEFTFHDLKIFLESKIRLASKKSYTYSLFKDVRFLKRKILEEAYEVISSESKPECVKELADLYYHLNVFQLTNNITYESIFNELRSRKRS